MSDEGSGTRRDLILASESPRRAKLLRQLGVSFSIVPPKVDETVIPAEAPNAYVRRIALSKVTAVSAKCGRSVPVLGADTVVAIDEILLGKPVGIEHARAMLERLSGRWHEVYSGVAIMQRDATVISVRTRVKFRTLGEHEVDRYWASGEPQDKAGAYAIQGLGGVFVERIHGSYSNVVGLPMAETLALLDQYNVRQLLGLKIGAPEP
jgi:septum formation protein